ncbi:hypothetical protein [Hyphomonas sp. GM-8P]|nr:hypothetical protein [Hyphomonas sp. GM-8P]
MRERSREIVRSLTPNWRARSLTVQCASCFSRTASNSILLNLPVVFVRAI